MCLVPFHTKTKYIANMHLYTILLTLIQLKINEKGYILTRTTVYVKCCNFLYVTYKNYIYFFYNFHTKIRWLGIDIGNDKNSITGVLLIIIIL